MNNKMPGKKDYQTAHDLLSAKTFPVLIHLSDVLNRYVDIRFKDKIDWSKINALMIITIKGGTVNLSQLSSSMIRPKWTITKLVDAMERDGLVIRVSSTQDRRSTLVNVTRNGLAELEKSLALCDKAEKEIMDSLEKNEISTFEMVSRLLISRLVEVTSAYHDSSFYFHRGIFYKALGRKEAALTNFKRALETTGEKSFIRRIKQEVAELEK